MFCVAFQLGVECLRRIAQIFSSISFLINFGSLLSFVRILNLHEYTYSDVLGYFIVSPALHLCTTCSAASSPMPHLFSIPPPCSVSFLSSRPPYNIAASFSFLWHPLSFSALLLGGPCWDRGWGPPEGPMCLFVCSGQEKAEEDLRAWTGRAPRCEPGRRRAGEVLPCCGTQPLPWWDRGNYSLNATVSFCTRGAGLAAMGVHHAAMRGLSSLGAQIMGWM